MKRTIISCIMAVGLWLTATAANTVTLTSVQGHPGDEVEVAVALTGESAVTAIELLVPLGDMLRYVDDSAVLSTERADGHTLTAAGQDGKLSMVIFSPTLAPLKGVDGELCRFKVKLGKEPADYTLTPEVVMSDASGNALTCSVESGVVTLLSPKIEVTTPTIDYGRVPIRSEYTHTLSVYNSGNEPLEITGIAFDNSDLTASPVPCTIAAGGTQDFTLTYAPLQRGTVTSNVTITSNAINPKAGKAVVTAQPFSVNELHVQHAEGISDEEVTVVLKMNNMEPIAGAQCEFTLPEALKYVEGSAVAGSRCSGTDHRASGFVQGDKLTLLLYSASNATLPEGDGELLTFRVRLDGQSGWYELNPQEVVLSNATVENMTSATSGEYVVIKSPSFSGNSTLEFGDTPVTQKATATYTIYNNGEVNLTINKVTFLAEGYAVEESLPLTIAPWESRELTVAYTPTAEGEHRTTMQVYTNDPLNRMYSVAVSGRVYEPNRITVSGDNTKEGYRFAFSLDNYTDIVAVQMNVKWLPGMTTSTDRLKPSERLNGHAHLVTSMGDGLYQLLIYSMANTPIVGNSGELFTLDYTASGGTEYLDEELIVSDIVLSDAKGNNYVSESEVRAKAMHTNFALRFVVEGETVSEQFVKAGTAIIAPEVAERVGHSFAWTGLPQTMPSNDVTVTGTYTANSYTITYMVDGEVYKTESLSYGSKVEAIAAPTKEGHTFSGWSEIPTTMPAGNITVNGSFTVNSYSITYMVDGEVYKTESLSYGSKVETIAVPAKEGHTFSGWSGVPTIMPAKDMVISGTFTVNSYTMTYMVDDEVYQTVIVAYGNAITLIDTPTKEGYTFSGWSEAPETMPAKDVTVTGSFTVNSYTLTYIVDGEVYKKESLAYGSKVEAIAAPTKEGYTFSGWSGVPTIMPAKDVTVSGSFTVNSYTVTYVVDGEVYKTENYVYGTAITAVAVPTKEGHTFSGWSEIPATMPAGNVTVTGSFAVNSYTVTFVLEGEVFAEYTLKYGSTIDVPEAPQKEGLTFSGWGKVPETMPAQDLVFEGSYMNNPYTIIYIVDGVEYHRASVEYGSVITLIAAPVKEGHTFSGWSVVPETMPAGDITVSGSFTVNSYNIIYYVDGEEFYKESIPFGTSVSTIEAPQKEGYTFSGWSEIPTTMSAKDVTINGAFSINTYIVTFMVDGEEYCRVNVVYGEEIIFMDTPTKEGHTFSGWREVPTTMPAKDITITGSFTVNSYSITYMLDGKVYKTDSLAYGSKVGAIAIPTKEGHTFSGWSGVPATMPAKDVTISGTFTVNTYTVTYIVDGEVYQTVIVAYGDSNTLIDAPTKEGYTFSGWLDAPSTMPAHDVTINGRFVTNAYTATFMVDGEVYKTFQVEYGAKIPTVEPPSKEGHTFSGWSEVPETMPAKDVTVTGYFTINKYFVTFKIGDEVIAADSLEYGASIVAPEASEKEGYTFDGWGEVAEIVPANDVIYEGSYTINSYQLTYVVDGETVKSDSVVYGTAIVALEEPTKEGHTFSGWNEVPATMPAKDVTVTGYFTINKYLVTFKIGDEVIAADSLEYGAAIVAPDAPDREGYTFDGWGEVAETVPASDVTYEGSYTVNIYKVYYYVDEELVHTAEVAYGEPIPEYVYEPTEEGYTFLGWIGDTYETMPAHDVTYTANIDNGIEQLTIDNGQLTIYDLKGRKVTDTENLKGGIYIVNGKKVVIK